MKECAQQVLPGFNNGTSSQTSKTLYSRLCEHTETIMKITESLLLSLAVICLRQTLSTADTMSACFGQRDKTLQLDCGSGNMVQITRAFYGFSPSGECRLTAHEKTAGCTVPEYERYGCMGKESCEINLPTGQRGVDVPTCGQRSNYFQVEYTCVPARSVNDICQSKQLTAQSGYIMTPRYPANYHQQGECSTTIQVHPTQKIRLHIIDMNLKAQSRLECADLLYFNDKLRSITLCGERANNSYDMHSNFLHVELQSTSGGASKGFWLYYEAWPPLPTSLLPPEVSSADDTTTQPPSADDPWQRDHQGDQVTKQEEEDKKKHKENESIIMSTLRPASARSDEDTTVPLFRTSSGSSDKLPFAAIAGGVIGTLSLILIVLLLLLFIKWYNERRYNRVEKVLEIRNPAFRSSTDFQEAQHSSSCPAAQFQHHVPNNSGYYC